MSGFKSRTDSGIRVVSGETVTLTVELSIGEVSETVEVTAALPNIDKQTNKAGSVSYTHLTLPTNREV